MVRAVKPNMDIVRLFKGIDTLMGKVKYTTEQTSVGRVDGNGVSE